MRMVLKPYTLQEAQSKVKKAKLAHEKRVTHYNKLEMLYSTGEFVDLGRKNTTEFILDSFNQSGLERINLSLANMNIIMSSVGEELPQFTVRPILTADGINDEQEEDVSVAASDMLKYYWEICNGTEMLRKMVKDLVLLGCSFAKVGWISVDVEVDIDPREQVDAIAELISQGLGEEEALAKVPTVKMQKLVDQPFLDHVRPHDILVAPGSQDLETARWVCHVISKPVDEVRAEFELPNSFEISTNKQNTFIQSFADINWSETENIEELATFYEFYDQRTRRMIAFQEGALKPLFNGPAPTPDGRAPFVRMKNYEMNPADFYGFGDLVNVAPLQEMLNEMFTLQMDNARRAGTMHFINEELITQETKGAITHIENGVIVGVTSDGRAIGDNFYTLDSPALSSDVYMAGQSLERLIAQIIGLSDFEQGKSGADRMSGTAASAVVGASSLRASPKQGSISRGLGKIGSQILALAAQCLTEDLAIEVAGADAGLTRNIAVSSIRGQFLVSVEGGSIVSTNKAATEQQAVQLANMILPLAETHGFSPEPIIREIFRKFGLNPDIMLKKAEQPVAPEETGMPAMPDMSGMGAPAPDMAMPPMDIPMPTPQEEVGGLVMQNLTPEGGQL